MINDIQRAKELASELYELTMRNFDLKIIKKIRNYVNGNREGTYEDYSINLYDAFGIITEAAYHEDTESKVMTAFLARLDNLGEEDAIEISKEHGLCLECYTLHVFDNGHKDCCCGALVGEPDRPIIITRG